MTTVNVGFGISDPSHDLSLSDGTTTLGLIFAGGPRVLQEMPLSPPAQAFENEQENWIGGRGRVRFHDDPTGFADSFHLWSTTDGKLMPSLQWRFAQGLRTAATYLPTDNQRIRWWKLYGVLVPATRQTRFLSMPFTPSATITADKGYLIIRRRGSPGTLTFELCANNSGSPGTVLQTVTKTVTNITDTLSVYQLFDWTGTESLASGTLFHLKIYGATTDSEANHWEVLGTIDAETAKFSLDNSVWNTTEFAMYYRVTDADTARQWRFFSLEGAMYAAAQNDNNANSKVILLGVRGTATSGTSTTLVNSGAGMTVDAHIGAYIRIFDGTGDGQFRLITDNDGTSFTVSPAWDVTPDNTSRYIVYASDIASTLTTFSAPMKGKPVTVDKVTYFPMGQTESIRKMQVNGSSHDFNSDAVASKADVMYLNLDGPTPLLYLANAPAATIQSAAPVVYSSNLTLSTAKSIGSSEFRITNLISHNKVMQVLKEDGIYSYMDGIVQRDGENFSNVPDPTTGIGAGAQNSALWFGWGHSLVRKIGTSVDDMLNFKRGYEGMPDNRKGYCSCIVSAVGWLFFVFDGGASNYSTIMIWNGMGFHEVFRGWATGVRIRNAFWQSNIGTRGRLWFDVGGDLAYIEFPLYAANPLKDTSVNYNWEGAVVTATYDAHDANLYKIASLLRLFQQIQAVGGSVEVDYQTDTNVETGNWTVLGTADDTVTVEDLDINLGEIFQIRFRFRLQTAKTRVPTVVTGWQVSGRQMPLDKYQYLCTFKAESDSESFGDEPDHDPDTVFSQLQTWARQQTKLTMRTQGSSSDQKVVTVSLPSKSVDSIDSQERKWKGRVTVAILET
jgi:hypothetical protein